MDRMVYSTKHVILSCFLYVNMPQPADSYRNSGLLGLGNIAALPSYCGNVPGPVTYSFPMAVLT
jgi:hypothetical protein